MEQLLTRFRQWLTNDYPPKEMWNDPKLKHLNVRGPYGPSHDRMRRAYYAIRDGRGSTVDKEKLKGDLLFICDLSYLNMPNDTGEEFRVLCSEITYFLGKPVVPGN
jgi:hypothetical protein